MWGNIRVLTHICSSEKKNSLLGSNMFMEVSSTQLELKMNKLGGVAIAVILAPGVRYKDCCRFEASLGSKVTSKSYKVRPSQINKDRWIDDR